MNGGDLHPSPSSLSRTHTGKCSPAHRGGRGLAGPRLDGQAARRAKPRRHRGKLASGTGLLGAAAPDRKRQWQRPSTMRAKEGARAAAWHRTRDVSSWCHSLKEGGMGMTGNREKNDYPYSCSSESSPEKEK